MMGYEPHALPSVITNTSLPTIKTYLRTLTTARNEALAAHELTHQVMAFQTQHSFTLFTKGDKVWLEACQRNPFQVPTTCKHLEGRNLPVPFQLHCD
jgi:hypothetical protein